MMRSFVDIFKSYAILDGFGRHIGGSDRQSNHAYGLAYDALFPPEKREDVEFVLEIGNADGNGCRSFREAFPHCKAVVGLDIVEDPSRYRDSMRLEFHIGDQRSREACERAAGGRQFDLIVDDGLHDIGACIATFMYLWPSVKPGGVYVVEECGDQRSFVTYCHEVHHVAVEVLETNGPFGGIEPLLVIRKPCG